MRKIFCLLFATLFLFCGCVNYFKNNYSTKEETSSESSLCQHSYVSTVFEPTCESVGYTQHICSKCKAGYRDTPVAALGHTYIEGKLNYFCQQCGRDQTKGFTFRLTKSETSYSISNATWEAVSNRTVDVPQKYNSLPVVAIEERAFFNIGKYFDKLIIHDNIRLLCPNLFFQLTADDSKSSHPTLKELCFDDSCQGIRINELAFSDCSELETISMPATGLANNYTGNWIPKNSPYFRKNKVVENGITYIADILVEANKELLSEKIIIRDGTRCVESGAFFGTSFIKSVTIPISVSYIGSRAFASCSNLESIIYGGTTKDFYYNITKGTKIFGNIKATSITCTDGIVTDYLPHGYGNSTEHIGW